MFTFENLILLVLLAFVVLNFQSIVSGFVLYFWELRRTVVETVDLEEVDQATQELTKAHEDFLTEKGFVYQSSMQYQSMLARFSEVHYTHYYYHEALGVHAFVETTPLPGYLTPAMLSFTTMYESYKRTMSYDCFDYNIFTDEDVYLFDHYHGSNEEVLKSHLIDREIEGELIVKQSFTAEGAKDFCQYTVDSNVEEMKKHKILKETNSGYKYAFSLGYMKYIHNSLKGFKRARSVYALAQITSEKTATPVQKMLYKTAEERALLALLEQKTETKSKEGKIKTFMVSGAFFVLFFGMIGIPWSSLPIIIAILLIHELGHYWAMRYYGYQDTSIFFIPLFGAAAKGEKEHTNPFEEYVVFLAGPLPGMILSLVIAFFIFKEPSLLEYGMLKEFAIMSFVINFFNLLPIYPLDGGRIIQTLVFTRFPKAQFYFFLASLTVIIGTAIALQSILLGFFAVLLFMNINHNYNLALLLSALKKTQSDETIKEKIVSHIVQEPRFKPLPLVKKSILVKQALKLLNAGQTSKLLMFLGMAFYLLLLIVPVLFIFFVKATLG